MSDSPCHFSGRGRNDFVNSRIVSCRIHLGSGFGSFNLCQRWLAFLTADREHPPLAGPFLQTGRQPGKKIPGRIFNKIHFHTPVREGYEPDMFFDDLLHGKITFVFNKEYQFVKRVKATPYRRFAAGCVRRICLWLRFAHRHDIST